MAPRLTSLFLLLLLTACLQAQPFGRFGYKDTPTIPGLSVDREGFIAKFSASDKFFFSEPVTEWKVAATNAEEQTVALTSASGPDQLKVSIYSPGFLLHFPKGFSLKLRSTAAPYLSWREGSVGENVPTPSSATLTVSFKDNQPPIVLGFIDGPVSLQVEGRPADWTLKTLADYSGWVRVALPLGTKPFATASAATLGQLSMAVAASDPVWSQPPPRLLKFDLSDDYTAVEATWTFDRKLAVVPAGAALANLGEYPLTVKTRSRRLAGSTEEGPTTISDDERITVRFPVHRIPLGRAITVGAREETAIGTVSAYDIAGVAELAMENLLAARDLQARKTAEETVSGFIQDVQYTAEPFTGQQLPYAADGSGIDVAAANALLWQAYTMSTRPTSTDNSLLTSVSWRRDAYSWRIWTADQAVARRAGALAAFAGALCPEPMRRFEAAMAQAGLAAERGLGIYFAREAGKLEEPTYFEPLFEVRNTIFEMAQQPRHTSPFAATLFSEVRIFGDVAVRCTTNAANETILAWSPLDAPTGITLASAFPLELESALADLKVRHFMGYTALSYSSAGGGDNTAKLLLPTFATPLPKFAQPPRYAEPVN